MVSLEEIEREISELETRDTSYRLCERLAWLYVCRDHLKPQAEEGVTQRLQGSEFLELSSGVSYPALMRVIDEHLDAVRILYPKSYESLLDKIRALR
jgi:hypothetical protein